MSHGELWGYCERNVCVKETPNIKLMTFQVCNLISKLICVHVCDLLLERFMIRKICLSLVKDH